MYDTYHPIKSYFSQNILCFHVYQFPEAAIITYLEPSIVAEQI